MRARTQRSVNRPRPVLMLETLEDRRVMSAGGLFASLQPFATAPASHAPLFSTLTSLVAVPTTALSSVSATARDLGSSVLPGPAKTAILNVPLNGTVDVLFLHVENLRLDLGLNQIGSDQPLLTVAAGAKTTVGPTSDGPLSVAPQIQLGLGGSNVVSQSVTAPLNGGGVLPTLDVPMGGAAIPLLGSSTGAGLSFVRPAGNASGATNSNLPVTLPAGVFGSPSSAALLTAPAAVRVDGGGGSGVDAALAVAPITDVPVGDGVAAQPIDLGGGTDAATVLVNPGLEASGLTTQFQPFSLDSAGRSLGSLLGRVSLQSGWLAAWLVRLSHLAPWLTGLIAVGAALEIRRRRSRAAKALNRSLAG